MSATTKDKNFRPYPTLHTFSVVVKSHSPGWPIPSLISCSRPEYSWNTAHWTLSNTRSISNSECASLSGVDFWFELQLGQTKDYDIGICCFSLKHATQISKSKDKLAQNQENVSVERYVYLQTVYSLEKSN